MDEVLAEHGHVDVLVNNAGRSMRRPVHLQYDRPHDLTRTMDVNDTGPVRLVMGLLPSMRERRTGREDQLLGHVRLLLVAGGVLLRLGQLHDRDGPALS